MSLLRTTFKIKVSWLRATNLKCFLKRTALFNITISAKIVLTVEHGGGSLVICAAAKTPRDPSVSELLSDKFVNICQK